MSDRDTTPRNPRQAQPRRQHLLRDQAPTAGSSLNPLEWEELSHGFGSPKSASPTKDQSTPRKWTVDGLTFFQRLPKAYLPVIESIPLTAEPISSAFVSGRRHPTLPPETHYSGAVYRDDRKIVSEFLEYDSLTGHRVPRRDNPQEVETRRVKQAIRIDRTCVYMGPLSRHFGHFLLESLQRAWYLKEADPTTLLLFHGQNEQVNLPSFARIIFSALDVDPARIRIAVNDLQVSRLILPASQFWQGIKASPGMGIAFDHVREKILKSRPNSPPTPARIYFSRKGLSPERGAGRPRAAISNEEEVEALFRKRGYEILQPETLPFEEQVALVANATHVAGPSGSALHLMLFNDNPRTKLIELRTKPAVNQLLISAIRPAAAFHIWSAAKDRSPQKVILDTDVIERSMRQID